MNIQVNGNKAGDKENGCALCGATWGSYYEEIDRGDYSSAAIFALRSSKTW